MKAESPTAGAVPKPASTTTKKVCEKKPVLACLFCRGRKIACGPPLPGSKDKTCNQCARRHLKCVYPTESRRGQRKRVPKVPVEDDVTGAPVPPSIVSSGTQGVGSSSTKGNRKSRQSDRHGGGT
ncbi:hypothetical protein NEOLEDRAFT_1057141 [Neolentinus lepideus HHB14362 ss-1]|uniref:Zn(2)-C6 fungal-type domain-containing protein n=1 Tax=Neolentinus lepideus HHB14362 ss-1 TaxID=1314782 RepID=A0A165V386_9AGAM|nr:hypothetical protein NEOLEDRAFT_1057141 [Neolentinus lepideus HHB14362 ss-1]